MRIPISWLADFVRLDGLAHPPGLSGLLDRITEAGIEVDGLDGVGALDPRVIVGSVVDSGPVPGADRLTRVRLDVGRPELVQTVTGAPNVPRLEPGSRLPVALVGAQLFDNSAPGVRIARVRAAEVRGVLSEAVLCSPHELGVEPDRSVVLELDGRLPVGKPMADVVALGNTSYADRVIDIAILPNIARCQSIVGVAREVGALLERDTQLNLPLSEDAWANGNLGGVEPVIEVPDACHAFAAALIDRVRIAASPEWVQRRLAVYGMDPINNVVDATNYVMVELGQPMHAYDADRLSGERLGVRRARDGESIRLLGQGPGEDGTVIPPGTLVIESAGEPISVAGVIGGLDTAVADTTTTLHLESANFDFFAIRRAQTAMGMRTEASARFSRGVDRTLTRNAIRRFLAVLRETAPEARFTATGYAAAADWAERHIVLRLAEVNYSLGTSFSDEEILAALARLHLLVERKGDGLVLVTPPSWRGDLTIPVDLIEEVARLLGYHRMPESMPVEPVPAARADHDVKLRERVRDAAVLASLQEVITYTLSSRERERDMWAEPAEYTVVVNPVSPDRSVMRRTLLPGLIEVAELNLRHRPACQLFELGVVVHPEERGEPPTLPAERHRLGILLVGPLVTGRAVDARVADFFDVAAAVEVVTDHLHVPEVRIEADSRAMYRDGAAARVLTRSGELLGHLGVVDQRVLGTFGLDGHEVVCAELDVEALAAHARHRYRVVEPSRHPSVEVDITAIVDHWLPAQEVLDAARHAGGEVLANAAIIDAYSGKAVEHGKKAVTVRLALNARTRTLRKDEAGAYRDKAVRELERRLGAVVRGVGDS